MSWEGVIAASDQIDYSATDTPRTDEMVREVVDAMVGAGREWDFVVPAAFARELERAGDRLRVLLANAECSRLELAAKVYLEHAARVFRDGEDVV